MKGSYNMTLISINKERGKCCYKCFSPLLFNDNSITRIENKLDGVLIEPIYYCSNCNTYYDGFTAHLEQMEEISLGFIRRHSIQKWFNKDMLNKIHEYKTLIENGMKCSAAYNQVFRKICVDPVSNKVILHPNMVRLSDLSDTELVVMDGNMIHVYELYSLLQKNVQIGDVFTVTDNSIRSILDQAYQDFLDGKTEVSYSSENTGAKQVLIDISFVEGV